MSAVEQTFGQFTGALQRCYGLLTLAERIFMTLCLYTKGKQK